MPYWYIDMESGVLKVWGVAEAAVYIMEELLIYYDYKLQILSSTLLVF